MKHIFRLDSYIYSYTNKHRFINSFINSILCKLPLRICYILVSCFLFSDYRLFLLHTITKSLPICCPTYNAPAWKTINTEEVSDSLSVNGRHRGGFYTQSSGLMLAQCRFVASRSNRQRSLCYYVDKCKSYKSKVRKRCHHGKPS